MRACVEKVDVLGWNKSYVNHKDSIEESVKASYSLILFQFNESLRENMDILESYTNIYQSANGIVLLLRIKTLFFNSKYKNGTPKPYVRLRGVSIL